MVWCPVEKGGCR